MAPRDGLWAAIMKSGHSSQSRGWSWKPHSQHSHQALPHSTQGLSTLHMGTEIGKVPPGGKEEKGSRQKEGQVGRVCQHLSPPSDSEAPTYNQAEPGQAEGAAFLGFALAQDIPERICPPSNSC